MTINEMQNMDRMISRVLQRGVAEFLPRANLWSGNIVRYNNQIVCVVSEEDEGILGFNQWGHNIHIPCHSSWEVPILLSPEELISIEKTEALTRTSQQDRSRLAQQAQGDGKVQAIKELRDLTACGLRAAKELVEEFMEGQHIETPRLVAIFFES